MGRDFDSKDDYLSDFRRELETRGRDALSASAIERALDDASEKFEMLLGRGRTPSAVVDILGAPHERAEVTIATRLLKLRPGSEGGPRLVTYLRVIRALAIVAPVNLFLAALPPLALFIFFGVGLFACAAGVAIALISLVTFEANANGVALAERISVGAHFFGWAAVGVFAGCLAIYALRAAMFLVWKWSRWNVNFINEDVT